MRKDFAPFYRSTVGFDRIFDLLDNASRDEALTSWPPYNIEKTGEDHYRITMAVAGFAANEIEVVAKPNLLSVAGQRAEGESSTQILYHGIASRPFTQTFEIADHVRVAGANLDSGLLTIDLVREVPEAMKPRRIEIASSDNAPNQDDGRKQMKPSAGKAA